MFSAALVISSFVVVVVLWDGIDVVLCSSCDPTRYLCSGECPPLPPGMETPTSAPVCAKDPRQDTCICWLHNPSSPLQTFFQCEARVNNSLSKLGCHPPTHCFQPDPKMSCLIILGCQCTLYDDGYPWRRVKAIVHTMVKNVDDSQNAEGGSIEKIQNDVREFSMKHLLFLLGFVIAPLLCWCLLNFFHEGKCRKKPLQPPEAQPIPTSRSSTVDDMNNEEGVLGEGGSNLEGVAVLPPFPLPTAPLEETGGETAVAAVKCESPPPYCDSTDAPCPMDCGPPPTYEDAVRGSDINVQQLWQTVFIMESASRENS